MSLFIHGAIIDVPLLCTLRVYRYFDHPVYRVSFFWLTKPAFCLWETMSRLLSGTAMPTRDRGPAASDTADRWPQSGQWWRNAASVTAACWRREGATDWQTSWALLHTQHWRLPHQEWLPRHWNDQVPDCCIMYIDTALYWTSQLHHHHHRHHHHENL